MSPAPDPRPPYVNAYWRTGTKVGRTVYAMVDGRREAIPADCNDTTKLSDVLIGMMDTPRLAAEVVVAHNARLTSRLAHPAASAKL